MLRQGNFKLNYYLGEPVELFDLATDPAEFHELSSEPAHAAVRDELSALALRDWDPVAIDRRARESQRLRRVVVEGSPTSPSTTGTLPTTTGPPRPPARRRDGLRSDRCLT